MNIFGRSIASIIEDLLEHDEHAVLKEEPRTVDGLPLQPIDDTDDTEDVAVIENCSLCLAHGGLCSYHQGMYSDEELSW